MDADTWHHWCSDPMVEAPPVLSLYRWKHLSPDEWEAHTDHLYRYLHQMYLATAEWAAVSRAITKRVRDNAAEPFGTKDIIGLTGPNLIGKSTLMTRWGRDQYNLWTRDADRDERGRPVLHPNAYTEVDLCSLIWIDLRDMARNSTMDREFLSFLNLPPSGNNDAISIQTTNAFKRHGTLAVIVDDTHLAWLDSRYGRQILDHIKYLNTQLGQIGATLILIGANLEDLELVHDPQIRGRLQLLALRPYTVASEAQQARWQRAVKQIEDLVLPYLPAGKPGMLYLQFPGELWHRTNGFVGHMTKLVVEATLAATHDGTHRITRRHLDDIVLSEGLEDARRRSRPQREPNNEGAGVKTERSKRNSRTCQALADAG